MLRNRSEAVRRRGSVFELLGFAPSLTLAWCVMSLRKLMADLQNIAVISY